MKPIPIPDHQVFPGSKRITLGAPLGEESWVSPLEALYIQEPEGHPSVVMALIELDEVDLKALQEPDSNKFWLVISGPVAPFRFGTYLPDMQREHEHKYINCGPEDKPIGMCLRCGRVKENGDSNNE